MDNLIEKYGFKKILFIVLGMVIIVIAVVLLINSSSSKKKLLECSQYVELDSDLNYESKIIIYKNKKNYKLDMKLKYNFSETLNNDELEIGRDWFDNNILDEYSSIKSYANTTYELKDNYVKYDISYDITLDNYLSFIDAFEVDFYSMSVDEIRNIIESGGYKCTE